MRHGAETRASGPISSQLDPIDAVAALMPWSGPEDRPLRLRLHKAGATAVARAMRSEHADARQLLWLAAQICHERAFARIEVQELNETISAISRLGLVVHFIERTGAPDAVR